MIGSIFYIALAAGVAYYADSKGRSPIVWGIVAFLVSPVLAFIILAFLKNLKTEQNLQQVMNQQEQINDRISVNEINNNRRFEKIEENVEKLENKQNTSVEAAAPVALGSAAAQEAVEPVEAEVVEPVQEQNVAKCPYCESEVPAGSKFCGNCGAKL